ncbi:hypothetical protein BNJ_00386 [Kaumoebavirus]|uniref:hypothetical protein n=1 Tax=Kaumoebavirus TaxID=1859492 RepID=UPI0009C34D1F|nr:hypothetical protein BNJ_00386 [Kaumoebavirus]ARA72205.1 hypothetical protein BNJ_00386 [Kaumoebavirus]
MSQTHKIIIALQLIVIFVLIFMLRREGFENKREAAIKINEKTKDMFDGGKHSYTEFKKKVGDGTDPVIYQDVLTLHKKNEFTVDNIERVL